MLSAEASRENISKYIESPNEYNSWQFTFWFLIIRLLVKWLWHGRSNYGVQYIKKDIVFFKIFYPALQYAMKTKDLTESNMVKIWEFIQGIRNSPPG